MHIPNELLKWKFSLIDILFFHQNDMTIVRTFLCVLVKRTLGILCDDEAFQDDYLFLKNSYECNKICDQKYMYINSACHSATLFI